MHLYEESDEEDEDMKEHALVVHNNGKVKGKFKGKCYHCGKKVHITVDCFLKKKEVLPKSNYGGRNLRNFNGSCHNCGKRGHKSRSSGSLQITWTSGPATGKELPNMQMWLQIIRQDRVMRNSCSQKCQIRCYQTVPSFC